MGYKDSAPLALERSAGFSLKSAEQAAVLVPIY